MVVAGDAQSVLSALTCHPAVYYFRLYLALLILGAADGLVLLLYDINVFTPCVASVWLCILQL
jgi:hypothetical protein